MALAFGFIPVKRGSNTPYNAAVNMYFVPSSDGTALYVGDPVALTTTADTLGQYLTVTRATVATNNKLVGVVTAVLPVTTQFKTATPLQVPYRAASTNAYVLVSDDPDQEYIAYEDAAGAVLVATDFGNLGLAIAGSGSNTYGRSGFMVDSSTFASGSATTDQWRLLGLVNRPDIALGAGTTQGAIVRVKINPLMHQNETPSATI
jgi:hypothetical protein